MKKAITLLILVFSVFLVMTLSTGVYHLSGGSPRLTQILSHRSLVQGHIHNLLFSRQFWSVFPHLPPIQSIINIPALWFLVWPLWCVFYFLGIRKQSESISIGLASLACGLFPHITALWALHGNGSIDMANKWMAVILMGWIDTSVICCVFTLFNLLGLNLFKAMAHVPMPKVTFSTQT
jgi:hypothetical protein